MSSVSSLDLLQCQHLISDSDIHFDLQIPSIGLCVFGYDFYTGVWSREIRGTTVVPYRYHRGECDFSLFPGCVCPDPIARIYGSVLYFLPYVIQLDEGYLQYFPVNVN